MEAIACMTEDLWKFDLQMGEKDAPAVLTPYAKALVQPGWLGREHVRRLTVE